MYIIDRLILCSLISFGLLLAMDISAKEQTVSAYFAGGCFWCMEPPYDKLAGVISTTSGYAGGKEVNPTYKQVSSGKTGHTEAVKIEYDPSKVNFKQLLEVYWRNIDPEAKNAQFCDKGRQYRSAIFYTNPEEQKLAEESKQKIIDSGKVTTIHTEIVAFTTFYPAEDYHQNYYKTNPIRYNFYRKLCGRDKRLLELWGAEQLELF